jgi:hypothetical protein
MSVYNGDVYNQVRGGRGTGYGSTAILPEHRVALRNGLGFAQEKQPRYSPKGN